MSPMLGLVIQTCTMVCRFNLNRRTTMETNTPILAIPDELIEQIKGQNPVMYQNILLEAQKYQENNQGN